MLTCPRWLVVSFLLALSTATVSAQEQGQDQAKMEAMWKAFATPGEQHAHFKDMEGAWSVETKDYMMNPSSPTVSHGEAKFETIMDGRFLVQHFHSTMNGQPFEGMGITGYDNAKKKYVGSWIDNMGTGVMNTEGSVDPETNTLVEYSEMSSPMGPMKIKMVTKHVDENRFTFTMFMMTPEGKETKSMELTYTRKKT